MDIKNAKLGLIVKHDKYGIGTIVKIDSYITVDFNIEVQGKRIRKFEPSAIDFVKAPLENITSNQDIEVLEYKKGDGVYNAIYGEGVILDPINQLKSLVLFTKDGGERIVFNNTLTKKEINIIDDEIDEELIDSKFKVIPTNYSEQTCYSTNAKRLLTYLRKKYPDEGIATIKSYKETEGEIGVIIIPSKGIVVFKMVSTEFNIETLISPFFDSLVSNEYEALRNYYYNAFLQSKSLCNFVDNSNKILKYPLKFVMLYQNVDLSKISSTQKKFISLKNRNIYFKNFTTIHDYNDVFTNFEKYDRSFKNIDNKMYGTIIERVVPENVTLISITPIKKTINKYDSSPLFEPITGNEREFSALCLDDDQIKSINDTKPGHYLTLANPGTGKSVLLISKAYRLLSMLKNNHVLVTCYNQNLAQHHLIFSEISGMKTSRMYIYTFHKFVKDVVERVDPYFSRNNDYENEEIFNTIVDRFEQLLDAGKIETFLSAILIDEIQLFEPRWIDICYKLLDKSNTNGYYFEMYGDINQDVKSQRSKGKASWQNTKNLPSLQGRVKKLEKNYRNTELIANYLKCMITDFNIYLSQHGIDVDKESASLSSVTSKKGNLKTKILISPNDNVSKVVKTIQALISKRNADYNDISVIYPARQFGKFYRPIDGIKRAFNEADIPYSFIHGKSNEGDEKRYRLFDCEGVIMSTIDSCLGLDFKYVILCGIHYWDFIFDEVTKKNIKLTTTELIRNNQAKHYINEIGKKIYSACSRAREGLFIIDDLDDKSPIKSIIRPKSGRSYFDEN